MYITLKDAMGRLRVRFEDLYKPGHYCEMHGRRENWAAHMMRWQEDHWRRHPKCLEAAKREARREELLEQLLDKLEKETSQGTKTHTRERSGKHKGDRPC